MLKKIQVDGFKSLSKFNLEFKKGLNVLVGSNGVGKTNICQAINLLPSLVDNTLFESLSQIGGTQSIINSDLQNKEIKQIEVKASGSAKGKWKEEKYEITYQYKFCLIIDESVQFESEKLLIRRRAKSKRFKNILKVERGGNDVTFSIEDKKLIGHNQLESSKLNLFFDFDESFMSFVSRFFYAAFLVRRDFERIKMFNINPNIARQSCGILESKTMSGDGKYFANNLQSLIKSRKLKEINSILRQTIPDFSEVKPKISEVGRKRYFVIKNNNADTFTSTSISDGTIKLMALLVGIIEQKGSTTIIEEPENYLHPYANKILINYLRDFFDSGICILSSHSETILNLIHPRELVLCNISENTTSAKRFENPEAIANMISKSGFGCGYHYIAGNFDD